MRELNLPVGPPIESKSNERKTELMNIHELQWRKTCQAKQNVDRYETPLIWEQNLFDIGNGVRNIFYLQLNEFITFLILFLKHILNIYKVNFYLLITPFKS